MAKRWRVLNRRGAQKAEQEQNPYIRAMYFLTLDLAPECTILL
jgi:hypothetical protein